MSHGSADTVSPMGDNRITTEVQGLLPHGCGGNGVHHCGQTQYHDRIPSARTVPRRAGEALSAIRDAKLYRATHGTFEDYCREKWGMSRRHCDRLIESSDTVQSLGPTGPKITSERQARELSRVEPARP